MVSSKALLHPCRRCGGEVSTTNCKTDPAGQVVHEHCPAFRLDSRPTGRPAPRKHQQRLPRNQKQPTEREVFSGWKEIAKYLGTGVRTVQRYEREQRFPVHRPAGRSKGVVATKIEIHDWLQAGPALPTRHMPGRWPAERTNSLGAQFLKIDSEIALTFAGLALGAKSEERRSRMGQAARKAYDTILRLRQRIYLGEAEGNKLEANLRRLRTKLTSLGQLP